jgi:hypothetical protein
VVDEAGEKPSRLLLKSDGGIFYIEKACRQRAYNTSIHRISDKQNRAAIEDLPNN